MRAEDGVGRLTPDDPRFPRHLVLRLDHLSPILALYGLLLLTQISSGMFLALTGTLHRQAIINEQLTKLHVRNQAHIPVARTTTSASRNEPSANLMPVFSKRSISWPCFIFTLPSMINWEHPTSI